MRVQSCGGIYLNCVDPGPFSQSLAYVGEVNFNCCGCWSLAQWFSAHGKLFSSPHQQSWWSVFKHPYFLQSDQPSITCSSSWNDSSCVDKPKAQLRDTANSKVVSMPNSNTLVPVHLELTDFSEPLPILLHPSIPWAYHTRMNNPTISPSGDQHPPAHTISLVQDPQKGRQKYSASVPRLTFELLQLVPMNAGKPLASSNHVEIVTIM